LNTEFSRFLQHIEVETQSEWFLYFPKQANKYYAIDLPESMENYTKQLSSKVRYDLKRGLTSFEKAGGRLELLKYETAESVSVFLESAEKIAASSWQKLLLNHQISDVIPRAEVLKDLANGGMLRCYVLHYNSRACAYAVGFQCNGIFNFYETAYDGELEKYSPGKALLYLLLEELCSTNRPDVFYFGSGEEAYKRRFANRDAEEIDVFLLKNTIRNRLKVLAHRRLNDMKTAVRAFRTMSH
jgi:CelD/BcsL family acetyltransferase involved in cellulose biosynthesis